MITPPRISTVRLELIAATAESVSAEMTAIDDFARMIDVQSPPHWPPPLNDEKSMAWFLRHLGDEPEKTGWYSWYFVLTDEASGGRHVIGNGGFKGAPNESGTVEIGYSLLEEYQHFGYATEAVAGLVSWAFSDHRVKRIIGETLPGMLRSIRVLEISRFVNIGPGSEEGIIRFELTREKYEDR